MLDKKTFGLLHLAESMIYTILTGMMEAMASVKIRDEEDQVNT